MLRHEAVVAKRKLACVSLLACIALVACHRPSLTVKRQTEGSIDFAELPRAQLSMWIHPSLPWTYEVHFHDFPEGTSVTLGGKATEVSTKFGDEEYVDIGDLVGDVSVADAMNLGFKLDPHIDFEVRVPGYAPTALKASPRIGIIAIVSETLVRSIARDLPVLFPRESASDKPATTHSIFDTRLALQKIYGPAAKLRDVDWVAIDNGGDVVIVERKTTKVISRKARGDAAANESWLQGELRNH
jgi:hypothetical protein